MLISLAKYYSVMTSENETKTNEKRTGTRRSTWSGVLKGLSGETIGYIYLYPTSAKKDDEKNE